jgi:flagellar hook-length control protein FliK
MQTLSIIPVASPPATSAPVLPVPQAGADFALLLVDAAPILPATASAPQGDTDLSQTVGDDAADDPLPPDMARDDLTDDLSDEILVGITAAVPAPVGIDVPPRFTLSLTVGMTGSVPQDADRDPGPVTPPPPPVERATTAALDESRPSPAPASSIPAKPQVALPISAELADNAKGLDDMSAAPAAATPVSPVSFPAAPALAVPEIDTPIPPGAVVTKPELPVAETISPAAPVLSLPSAEPDARPAPILAKDPQAAAEDPAEPPIPARAGPHVLPSNPDRPGPVEGEIRVVRATPAPSDIESAARPASMLAVNANGRADANQVERGSAKIAGDRPVTPAILPDQPGLIAIGLAPSVIPMPLSDPDPRIDRQAVTGHNALAAAPAITLRDLPQTVATALRETPDRQIELRLDPPELGAVRFGIDSQAAGLVVTIIAERPDTIDLMRRHAEQFLADLRQAGFHGASLQFGSSGNPSGQGAERMPTPQTTPSAANPATSSAFPAAAPPRPAVAGGLNLRL